MTTAGQKHTRHGRYANLAEEAAVPQDPEHDQPEQKAVSSGFIIANGVDLSISNLVQNITETDINYSESFIYQN